MTTRITTANIADGTIETIDIKTSGLGSGAIEDGAITTSKINVSVSLGVSNVLLEDGDNLLLDGTDGSSSNAGSRVQHDDVLDANAIGGTGGGGEDIALGVGQTWTEETSSRSKNVEYTNTTGRPIFVVASHSIQAVGYCGVKIDGADVAHNYARYSSSCGPCISVVVPAGSTYEYYMYGSVAEWWELK